MKRLNLLATVMVAAVLASCGGAGTGKVTMNDVKDSISYAIGMGRAVRVYKEQLPYDIVDSVTIKQFVKGFMEAASNPDDNSKLAYAIMKQAQIELRGETAGDLTEDDLCRIMYAATHYRIDIYGTKGFDFAQVTAGGADCSEFNPATMESKIIPGLYAAGEVLNVDGDCGGFNLMFAFSSGMAAGYAV